MNYELGNINERDRIELIDLAKKLYDHLYKNYDEFQKEGVNSMVTDRLVLPSDHIIEETTKEVTNTANKVFKLAMQGKTPEEIAEVLNIDVVTVKEFIE